MYKKYSSPFYFRPFLQQEHSSLILEQLWSGLNTCTCLILRKYFFNWHWICEDGNTQTQLSFPSQRFWLVLLLKSLWVAEWNRNPWPGKMQHNYASMLQKATSHNALSDTTCRHNTLHARIQNFFSRGIGLDEWSDGYLSLPVGHIFGYFTTQISIFWDALDVLLR